MPAQSLNGRTLAADLRASLAMRIDAWPADQPRPGLAVVAAGSDAGSQRYRQSLAKQWQGLGGIFQEVLWPEDLAPSEAHGQLQALSRDPGIHGVLLQVPLPDTLSAASLWRSLDPAKDVEGIHPVNLGRLWLGEHVVAPCTAAAVMALLAGHGLDPAGRNVVVVGRSPQVGKAIAHLFTRAHATVTLCHSRTTHLSSHLQRAEILVAAVGRAHLIGPEDVQTGAIVVDVATNVDAAGRLIGDVAPTVAEVAGWLSPVPGGVGPLTVAMLMQNVVDAAERARR
ncbi:MAG: bifunctional 5,10-methylenetetrahydrofolate dehydrogenase/5,10-methenyltetrahydrofolate cyclohydrolase [Candidatus Sericytochromatia bacterium]|nr:bifunctional 5,10-methylenetetrahydrofolate dehydrogenase/5,10-methenyltetrahydrofolate cyclohydrolase [Candidatus Sericytochromatia bacterium]